jgi:hypothetical protein
MFAEPCPSRTSSIKAYDGADEVWGDVLLVDVLGSDSMRWAIPTCSPTAV